MSNQVTDSKFQNLEGNIKKLTSAAIKLSIIILFSVVSWRIAWSSFSLDLSKFDFSDLLAMILALFAMSMSVAFYFKSTDSSNQFYDNIYNFTQKTSEILGRIEERFGERLKHIDEGYGRIESRFDGIAKSPDEIKQKVKETEGKEEKTKEKLEETNKEMRALMEELTKRAHLQQKEKEEFYQNMERLESERNSAQERLREMEEDRDRMQNQLHRLEMNMNRDIHELRNPVIEKVFRHPELRHIASQDAPARYLQKHLRRILEDFPIEVIHQLREEGLINGERELTTAGLVLLRTLSRR